MKKKFLLILSVLLLFLLTSLACFSLYPAKIDCGASDLYTSDEINAAIQTVRDEFKTFSGCKLFSLSYAGDEASLKEFEYCADYEEAIVIDSVFLSPLFRSGAWTPRRLYTWHFILMRNPDSPWQLLTYGYA